MICTANFHPKSDKKLLCTCGHKYCDHRSVNQFTLNHVQKVREDYGKAIIITSGGRCSYHPNERSKSTPGDHYKQYAVDVACNSKTDETKLKVLAGRYGATRVAGSAEDGFVHMAWTPTDRTDVPTWEY